MLMGSKETEKAYSRWYLGLDRGAGVIMCGGASYALWEIYDLRAGCVGASSKVPVAARMRNTSCCIRVLIHMTVARRTAVQARMPNTIHMGDAGKTWPT